QSPRRIWQQRGIFTDYEAWTIYRITLGTLRLYHDNWPQCPEMSCKLEKETIDHIIWSCAKAQLSWKRWLDTWLGHSSTPSERDSLQKAVAARQAPP
ncbi:hypothetical protein PHYSODRAFT_466254, partial [Phytophthora sojae]